MKKSLLLLALSSLFLTACGGQNQEAAAPAAPAAQTASAAQAAPAAAALDPILANPQVGDLYAAELSHFSAASFDKDNQSSEKAFGLMKVVEVQDGKIIVITEDAAWPEARGAKNELHGDLKTITWDENERIPVKRDELADLVAKGHILDWRRM